VENIAPPTKHCAFVGLFSVGLRCLFSPRFSAAGKTDSEANEVSVGARHGLALAEPADTPSINGTRRLARQKKSSPKWFQRNI
jgi:hypothetical protein